MFFRMLKKDILSKKRLTCILLLFMCLASILTVCSAIVLYANTLGVNKTLKKVNAAEVSIVSERSLDGMKERREAITDWLYENEKTNDVEIGECIHFQSNAVDYAGVDEQDDVMLATRIYYGFDCSMQHNKVTDMDGNFLDLPYGTVAIPQYVNKSSKVGIGDTVYITSQMGNIYEFKVGAITKDPAMNGWYRLFFNKEDFEVLKNDSPIIDDVYMVDLTDDSTFVDETGIVNDFVLKEEQFGTLLQSITKSGYNDDKESSIFLNIMMIFTAIFIVAMVFMTISFTIKTAIKSEEKELGMLKALGVESFSFNWLFAAKYIACAVISFVIGFFGGIHLAALDLKYITYGQLKPDWPEMIAVAFLASLMNLFLILFFVGISLRRMKRISIMDVISGENRGERFKKLPGFFLHKMKKINIPFYLALTDLTNRIKRYSFLIFAYTMGISAMLLLLEMNHTSNNAYWIEQYWGRRPFDFALDLPDEVMERYVERAGSTKRAYEIINREIKDAGIPAHIDYFNWSMETKATFEGKDYVCFFQFDYPYRANGKLYKGVNPKLENEVIIDAYHADLYGIGLGDTVSIEYEKTNEDGISFSKVKEDFIVVGMVDCPSAQMEFIMSDAFKGVARYETVQDGGQIDAPKSEHEKYIEMLRDMYGKNSVRNREEQVKYALGGYRTEWTMLLWILLPLLGVMMILATVLYQSVNVIDETPDIALLKCSGFSNGTVKAWQVIRSILITGISSVLGIVILNTVLYFMLQKFYYLLGSIVNYTPNRNILGFYVLAPLVVITGLSFVIYITLQGVKNIELWKLRDN